MAQNLERRRQAIADALRAVMAEPAPILAADAHADHDVATDADHAIATMPHQSTPGLAAQLRPRQASPEPAVVAAAFEPAVAQPASELPSIRAALAAEIDWETTDSRRPADEAEPEFADQTGAAEDLEATQPVVDERPLDESAPTDGAVTEEPDSDETKDPDTGADDGSGIPPIDTVGSMSRVASLALFGHA